MKLLIDECLSAELAKLARERGHPESSHVRWIGKAGAKDWELLPVILNGDWTFVTRNAVDFRGPADAPGTKGEYRKATLHAGLICLNGPVGMDLDMQLELFEAALAVLDEDDDLVNQVIEITLADPSDAALDIVRYALPTEI
jgi:hypothetical protein